MYSLKSHNYIYNIYYVKFDSNEIKYMEFF